MGVSSMEVSDSGSIRSHTTSVDPSSLPTSP
jgi:hypothetical protein